jgi:twitching motility two-component system response regulator PilG
MESMITNGKPRLAGLKVLVIDDSKTIRRTAETLLTKEGCEVFTTHSPKSPIINPISCSWTS